jgi:hypothetical protein
MQVVRNIAKQNTKSSVAWVRNLERRIELMPCPVKYW